jgi:hypothetical protein
MLLLVYGVRVLAEPFGSGIHRGCEIAMFTAKLTEVSFAQECFGVNGGKGLKVGHTLKKLKVGHALGKSCVRQRDAV